MSNEQVDDWHAWQVGTYIRKGDLTELVTHQNSNMFHRKATGGSNNWVNDIGKLDAFEYQSSIPGGLLYNRKSHDISYIKPDNPRPSVPEPPSNVKTVA